MFETIGGLFENTYIYIEEHKGSYMSLYKMHLLRI